MHPIIDLRHVRFGYNKSPILENINLHLHSGQFAAIVGPSGAGKSTLLKLILGMLPVQHGDVYRDASSLIINGEKPRALRMGYIPQLETIDWNFPVTVEQVVLMGRVSHTQWGPFYTTADKAQLKNVLRGLEIEPLAKRHIRDLSGGQQQRVFLARALISKPDLLVLDEPTSGVDIRSAQNILHILADLNRQGMTILMTTHDLNLAAAHVPWIVCLNKTIIAQGTPDDVFNTQTLYTTYNSEMLVVKQDGMIFIQQKPHGHTYRDVIPNPVLGHSAKDL
jgi:zinc/manganese transport system ATP-binding protein/zinc transport system ATP-binding protein